MRKTPNVISDKNNWICNRGKRWICVSLKPSSLSSVKAALLLLPVDSLTISFYNALDEIENRVVRNVSHCFVAFHAFRCATCLDY